MAPLSVSQTLTSRRPSRRADSDSGPASDRNDNDIRRVQYPTAMTMTLCDSSLSRPDIPIARLLYAMAKPSPPHPEQAAHPFTSNTMDWTDYLARQALCNFPQLLDGSPAQRALGWASIALPVPLAGAAGSPPPRLAAGLVEAAWAITLQCFVGEDFVCFGLVPQQPTLAVRPIKLHLDPSETAAELVEEVLDAKARTAGLGPIALPDLAFVAGSSFNTISALSPLVGHELAAACASSSVSLAISVHQVDSTFTCELWHRTTGLSQVHAANVASTYVHILLELVRDETQSLGTINLVGERDSQQIRAWNSQMPSTVHSCMHDLVSQQVSKTPSRTAICSWDGELSYAKLEQRSERLAVHLRQNGVKAEVVVPCCFEKSLWAVIAQLAILKAGGACTFVDVSHPARRVNQIVEQTYARLVLASPNTKHVFESLNVEILCVDSQNFDNLPALTAPWDGSLDAGPTSNAFVVYTSGSTGIPKGIVLEHAALCTSIRDHGEAMGFQPESRVLQFAAYSFDVSIADQFTTLIHGGCVCIPSEADRMGNLAEAINSLGVNQLYLTPTVASILSPHEVPGVKRLSLGGEAVKQSVIALWADKVDLINIYGPAEASIWCAYLRGLRNDTDPRDLGYAIGCQCHVIDPRNCDRLVPVGAVGEIVIQGPILARSYLDEPEKTRQAFLEHPRWPSYDAKLNPPSTIYRTGDLARYTFDGNLRFSGRKDTQAKLRGQRIEIEEVQHHLKACLAGRHEIAVDILAPAGEEQPVLIGYIVVSNEEGDAHAKGAFLAAPTQQVRESLKALTTGLRARLAQRVPRYMIPSIYIPLTCLPRSTSGKLDRKTLNLTMARLTMADLSAYEVSADGKGEALTPTESKLAALLASAVGVPKDILDQRTTLYDLGGDSMHAMKFAAMARHSGYAVSVKSLLAGASLRDLALGPTTENEEEVDGEFPPFSLLNSNNATQSVLDEASEQSRVPVDSIEDIYPCSPLQEGIFALSLKQPGSYVGRHSVMLPQDVNLAEYQTAWRLVAEENAIFRTRILHSETHGAFLQMVVKEDLRWSVGDPSQSNQLPPMLPGAPLVYLDIAVRGNPHCVVLHAHHALYDGWSLFKTFERVRDVYMGLSQGPSVPFARFIRHLQQLDPEASQHYWLAQMKGAPQCTFPALPHDGYSVAANANVSQHIADFTPPLRFTSATILRAAWALVLSKYEGSSDIIFGETLSGRSAMRTAQDMLGPTMTTVPLRVRIDEVSSLHEFLLAVQTTYADMLPFEHTGLGEIRRSCRKAGETCDFRSLLVIQPKTAQSAKVPTLLLSGVADIVAKSYPLMLELMLGEDSCDVRASFDSQIIDSRQAQRVLHQFSHVIRQLCRNEGDKYVQEIEVCSPEDVVELAIWNAPVPETHRTCVHTELRAQMLRSPDAEAISSWDGTFTYAQLAHYTSKLASHLRSIGVGPEVLVPLCFDKSGLAVLTGVAVLEAGGACVYVDPMYPRAKLENVLKKVNARHVVCGANYEALFQGASQTLVPLSFETLAALPTASDTQAPSSVCPENAAFVVFTSGSMGEPKGIVQDHTSYCSTMKLHGPILGSGPGRRVFQFSANTFDAFLSDVITTLANGGCVCIPSEYERINDLAATMRRMKVNQAMFTPTVVQLLEPEDIPLVKTMTLGGEPLLQNILLKWSEHLRIINLYGPSEVAIWCTYKDGLTSTSDPRNIGRGVGVSTWITDAENPERLAPIGGIGEILVAGPALARGYISDEKRTKASFISAPKWFNSLPNTMQWHRRLYRTGDLGRFNSDGSISIIGRRDSQVKLHGRRIELDEIENALRMCLNGTPVRRVAAEMIAPQRGSGETVLVAFMSFGEERLDERSLDEMASRATVGLQQAMCRVVAQHMVPSAFVGVDEIPSTLHGKTDRFKLRELGRSLSAQRLARSAQKDSSNGLRRPLTGKEVDLQRLWARILKVNPAGISLDDSFIALGGDSVSAMRLVSLARAEGISLSVANIFQSTTLQELATSLEDPASAQASACHSTDPTRLKLLPAGIEIEPILTTVAKMCDVLPDLIEDVYPCTAMQEGLMALSDQKAGAYVSQEVFDLQTAIDLPRLRSAFNEVVETFPILRTRIVWLDSVGFTQVVVRQRIPWYESNDLIHGLDNAKKSGLSQGEALTSFTVVNDPVQPSPILIWTIHHALYDGQSQRQLYEAVHKAYNGLRIPLPPNYNNYVRYITDKDRSESCSRFWSDHTRGFAFVKWPVAEQGPSLLRQDSAHIFMPIKRKPSSITMSTMLKAAWSIVVSKYTNSSQVAFGLTVAGRNAPIPSIEQMPGPTLATLPCCMEVSSSCSVGAYLSRVQRHSTDLIPFEHFGLQNIARLSPQAKDVCAFQNILVIQPPSSTSESTILDDIGRMSKGLDDFNDYPLMIFCVPGATGGVKVTANYQTSSVSQQQVDRVLNHFKTVLQQLLECEPGTTKVGAINMFSPEDRTELFRWNKHVPDRHYACLHDMIFSWSRWQPYDMAVCSWDGDMTYADLDQVSTALAVQLRALSVAHGQIVPLCFEKSRWTIVSMLAVHKCGAAFVPLDPVHPKSRHQEIIDDVEAQLLLCSPFINAYCIELGMPLLVVSSETVQPRTPCPQFEPVALQGNDVSHILFTSGTTGKPKGVVIEHQHMASSIAHHAPAMGFTRGTRVLQFSSYTFDVSIAEIMTTLVRGGCVCVPSEDDRTNNLTGVMNDMKVELAVLTPSVVRTLKPESLPSLKTLILGGEVVGGDIVERWADALNLINGYGPCECAVFSTIDYIANDGMHLDTIGSPVGCIAWIVDPDDHSTLVPIGCPGELVIQGPIVTRGYVNNLSRSQEPFFENPPWALTSQDQTIQRYYKTGDLVQFLPNGSLRLLGRQDTQVKVRGQRLELSEIEQKLTVDPNVEHAVVVFAKSGHLSERLAAVLTLRFGSDNTKTNSNPLCDFTADPTSANRLRAVRSLLEQKLPSFMLPSAFSIVNRFPFLQSGKLDRRRVQEWVENLTVEAAHTAMDLEATGVRTAPETRVERTMEAIWANVLNVDCEKIGTSRSFLSVGGDSITAMQVVAKARAQGLRTSVRDVLKSGSVQELAVLVKTAESDPIAGPDRLNESFELAPIQQWYFDLEPEAFGAAHFNQSFTLQINSPVKAAKVERAIRELYLTADPFLSYRFKAVDVKETNECQDYVKASHESLDISNGPLVAVDLFELPGKQLLSLVIHHLVVDLVSWRILLEELELLLRGQPLTALASLTFQAWQKLQREYAQRSLNPSMALPFVLPEPGPDYWGIAPQQNKSEDAVKLTASLDASTTYTLLHEANSAFGTEPLDIFLAATISTFSRSFKDRGALRLFNEHHGRFGWDQRIDNAEVVGWFTVLHPLLLPDELARDPLTCLSAVKDLRRAIPRDGWDYFTSRFLTATGRQLFGDHGDIELLFGYNGIYQQLDRADGLFTHCPYESARYSDSSPKMARLGTFILSVTVVNGSLQIVLEINRWTRHRDRIIDWLTGLCETLRKFSCTLPSMAVQQTLGDFPLLRRADLDVETAFRQAKQLKERTNACTIENIYPCTPLQQQMLRSQSSQPGLYAVSNIWRVRSTTASAANVDQFLEAWNAVVKRRAVLRTVFAPVDNGFVQVVLGWKDNDSPVSKQSGRAEVVSMEDLACMEPPDYASTDLPYRLRILESADEVYCRLDLSHTITDGLSITLLIADLCHEYTGSKSTNKYDTTFSDLLAYVHRLNDTSLKQHWNNYLAGVSPCLFPTPRSPSLENGIGTPESTSLQIQVSGRLKTFCRAQQTTLSSLFQAMWGLVVLAYTGSETACFGYLVSGRQLDINGIDDSVGPFLSLLAQKMTLKAGTSLGQALREVALDNQSNTDYLHSQQPSTCGLFNTIVNFRKYPKVKRDAKTAIDVELVSGDDPWDYDVVVVLEEAEAVVSINLRYRDSDCAAANAHVHIKACETALELILSNPEMCMHDAVARLRNKVVAA